MITQHQTAINEMIARIEGLSTARHAALRRACGERDPITGRCPWFYGLLAGATYDAAAFLVATLLAQYKSSDISRRAHVGSGSFGHTWRQAIAGSGSDSLVRRFSVLLDAEYNPRTGEGDLPYRLRQMVRYAVSAGVGIEWSNLLRDVLLWNHPDRITQKRWAQHFFAVETSEQATPSSDNQE